MNRNSKIYLVLMQLAALSITCGTDGSVFGQVTSLPVFRQFDPTVPVEFHSQPILDSSTSSGVSTSFQVVAAPPQPISNVDSLAFESPQDTAAAVLRKSENPTESSTKLEEKDNEKTLEERLQELEKSYKKDKEAAAKKKEEDAKKKEEDAKKDKKWFEKYSLRGYAQVRYNEVLSRDEFSAPPQYVGDRSVSEDQTFFLRRARLIFSGDMSDHLYLYLQPDFASTPDGSTGGIHFAQIRDWYADCYYDKEKVHRFRVGQSKIPYGWENLQSSMNRLVLDRNDALNSAVRNERDFGVIYYWTPEPAQEFFKEVLDKGLKGSGNYGVFGLGAYAGQGGSLSEQNDNLHVVSRFTLPMEFCDGQYAELGIQGYTGRYSVPGSAIRPLGAGASGVIPLGSIERGNRRGIQDERVAWTGVWYPQPLGFQTEWTVGRGPALNAAQTEIEERALYGGYAMTMYQYKTRCHGTVIPFLRWNYFKGGYKSERNAPFSMVEEWETGIEWQLNKQMELVTMYTLTDRTNTTAFNTTGVTSYQQFDGDLWRTQFQYNY